MQEIYLLILPQRKAFAWVKSCFYQYEESLNKKIISHWILTFTVDEKTEAQHDSYLGKSSYLSITATKPTRETKDSHIISPYWHEPIMTSIRETFTWSTTIHMATPLRLLKNMRDWSEHYYPTMQLPSLVTNAKWFHAPSLCWYGTLKRHEGLHEEEDMISTVWIKSRLHLDYLYWSINYLRNRPDSQNLSWD